MSLKAKRYIAREISSSQELLILRNVVRVFEYNRELLEAARRGICLWEIARPEQVYLGKGS